MFCSFFRKNTKVDNLVEHYQCAALRLLEELGNDYVSMLDIQGRVFNIKHIGTGASISVHEDDALNYWIGVLTALQTLEDTVDRATNQLTTRG